MRTIRRSFLALLTRRYPLYSGGIRLANHPLVQRLAGRSEEVVWARVKGGEVLCCLNDLVGRTAFYTGDLDRKISWICERIVKPGDTALDIGANIGIVSLWLSRLVGERGMVHAFEPNPELQKVFERAIERNQVSNIRLHRLALGASPSQMQLRIQRKNTGSGSLILDHGSEECKVFSVPVRTLDSILAEARIQAVQFIKMDVEGFEAQVLQGGQHMLKSIRPQAILFEFVNPGTGRLSDQAVFRLLRESGYGFFAVPKCRFRMYLEPFDPEQINHSAATDFLAVQKNHRFEDIATAVRARA